jgi:plasmid replication initiation protein
MKQDLIVKDNKLLQQPLYKTSMELKIFSMVLLKIRENPTSEIFSINVRELLEHFEGSSENYAYLKSVAKKMFGAIDLNPSDKEFDLNVIFTKIEVNQEGMMNFKLNQDIKFYVLGLTSNFTQYYFENIARLKSSFSIRIYEFLKQYEKVGSRKIELTYLRHFLNISDDKFLKYNDFKRKVILVSQKELKEKTDIYFEFEEIKQIRKIFEIKFTIYKNNKGSSEDKKNLKIEKEKELILNEELSEEQKNLKLKLTTFGMSEKTANELVLSVKMEQIESNIVYAEKEHKNGRISKNLGGYLLDAIKNNYANNISLFELEAKKKATDKENEKRKKEMEEKKEASRSKLSLEFSRTEKDRFINLLNDQEKEDLKNEILEEMSLDDFSVNSIKTKGLSSPAAGMGIIRRIPNFEKRREQFIAEKLKEAGLS